MFPKRMWVLPTVALALALVLTSVFASAVQAQGGTPAGEYCIKGIVIDWEENPLKGWTVSVVNPEGTSFTDVSSTDDDKDKGTFEFKVGDVYSDTTGTTSNVFVGIPGIYTASIEEREGWEGVTPTIFQFEIESGRDDCVHIRFKMRQIVPVTVVKIDADHFLLPDWTIDATPGPGNLFAEPQSETTDISGTVVFTLTPGSWIFTERQPAPVDASGQDEPASNADRYQPVLPPGGRAELDVEPLGPDDPPYFVVFKNEFLDNGCVVVRKWGLVPEDGNVPTTAAIGTLQSGPAYGAAGWGFQIQMTDGTVFAQGVTDAEGILVFRNLPFGPYTVVEEDRPGWDEITPKEIDVTVTNGDCVPVEFENQQDDSGFCIEGYKRDANGLYGIPNWEIKVTSVHEDGWDVEDEADFYANDPYYSGDENKFLTDGLGKYKIRFPDNDYRIPGQQFEVCENIEDADGWLPHTPICQTITMPDHPGACVQAEDFINQQVGHSESEKMKENQGDHQGDHQGDMASTTGWDSMPAGGHMEGQCTNTHVVKPGETLFTIGDSYNVSPQAMVDANPSVRSTPDFWVYVGQTLCIP